MLAGRGLKVELMAVCVLMCDCVMLIDNGNGKSWEWAPFSEMSIFITRV